MRVEIGLGRMEIGLSKNGDFVVSKQNLCDVNAAL